MSREEGAKYATVLDGQKFLRLYLMGSCKCRCGLSDPWNTCFIVHTRFFSVFSDIVLFCVSKIN